MKKAVVILELCSGSSWMVDCNPVSERRRLCFASVCHSIFWYSWFATILHYTLHTWHHLSQISLSLSHQNTGHGPSNQIDAVCWHADQQFVFFRDFIAMRCHGQLPVSCMRDCRSSSTKFNTPVPNSHQRPCITIQQGRKIANWAQFWHLFHLWTVFTFVARGLGIKGEEPFYARLFVACNTSIYSPRQFCRNLKYFGRSFISICNQHISM